MTKSKRKSKTKKIKLDQELITKEEIKENKFLNIFDFTMSLFNESAKFLLFLMTLILLITSLLFVVNVEITKFHLPVISIIAIIIYLLYKKKNLKTTVYAVLIGIIFFSLSTFAMGKIYDGTADGNTYHKLTIGALKNGWNPVYQDIADFNENKGNPFDILEDNVNVKWSNHYAMGTEEFGAVVYAFTGNIETSKVFNILWIYIGLFILYGLFKKMKINSLKSSLLALVLAINPISLTQIFNLYLDGVLSISLFTIIIIEIIKCLYNDNDKELNLILGMAIIWCCNVKFTGLAFAAIFCIVLYLYRHIRNFIKDKKVFTEHLIKETLYYIVVVILALVVVGSSTYTKNFVTHGHPLYPLYGKGHVANMVMMEMPDSMQEYSSLRIFLTSIFAKGENVSPSYAEVQNDPDLKIPFTTSREEISNYSIPDIRMGGFGPMFSGIFIITVIGLILTLIELIKKKEYEKLSVYGILTLTTIILVLALDGSYWARYIPYVFLLPTYLLIHLFKKDISTKKVLNIIGIIVVGIFAINSLLILKTQYHATRSSTGYINERIRELKTYYEENEYIEINLPHHGLQGVEYNLDDLGIKNYNLTEEKLKYEGYMFTYE